MSAPAIMDNTAWQLNPADTGSLDVQCTGLGGGELDTEWEILLACKREAHVYGPSLSKQDDWAAKTGTVAGTAHAQEYLLLHMAMLPIGLHTWCHVLGVPKIAVQVQETTQKNKHKTQNKNKPAKSNQKETPQETELGTAMCS